MNNNKNNINITKRRKIRNEMAMLEQIYSTSDINYEEISTVSDDDTDKLRDKPLDDAADEIREELHSSNIIINDNINININNHSTLSINNRLTNEDVSHCC